MATVKICDICGSRQNLQNIRWYTGRSEFNGIEREHEYLNKDICLSCLGEFLLDIVNRKILTETHMSTVLVNYMGRK